MHEIRCGFKLHGKVTDDGRLEVKCSSQLCGARKGTVVYHYFSIPDFELVETMKFKDPSILFDQAKTRKASA